MVTAISIKPSLRARVAALAQARGISRSRLIEELIEQGVESVELEVKFLNDPVLRQVLLEMARDTEFVKRAARVMGQDLSAGQLDLFARKFGSPTEGKDDVRKR